MKHTVTLRKASDFKSRNGWKIRVDKRTGLILQKYLFSLGFKWRTGDQKTKEKVREIYIHGDGNFITDGCNCGNVSSDILSFPEMLYDDICFHDEKAKVGDLIEVKGYIGQGAHFAEKNPPWESRRLVGLTSKGEFVCETLGPDCLIGKWRYARLPQQGKTASSGEEGDSDLKKNSFVFPWVVES